MRNRLIILMFVMGGLVTLPNPVWAVSISVDVDPGTAGIQNTRTVAQGTNLMVDVVGTGIGLPGLNGFEFDLNFDGLLISANSVVDGGFLLAPNIVVQRILGVTSVEFAEATLIPAGAVGSGTLATVTFAALAPGTSALTLNNVLLSAPFGVPIAIDMGLANGTITVEAGQPVIPEPSTIVLFGTGLAVLAAWRMKKTESYKRASKNQRRTVMG